MQLRLLLSISLLLTAFCVLAQRDTIKKVDVNFVFNYYEQDGQHSAVTGGKGTQELDDYSGKIQVVVDMDSGQKLFANISLNRYSSASTDRIDSRLSSASAIDSRLELAVGFEKKKNDSLTQGGNFHGAVESDYISMGLGYYLKREKFKLGTYGLKLDAFYDSWILIYPEELRRVDFKMAPTDKRYSLNLSQTFSWNMRRNMKAGLVLDFGWQNGMLGTPFHRVYFKDTAAHSIEQLPENRIKVPIGFQWNWFATDFLILKTKSRAYWDDFGVKALTFEVQTAFLLSNAWTFSPFYRFHAQSSSKYFNKYAENSIFDAFYTSDYDLSGFESHKVGAQINYAPLYGVLGKDKMGWKSVGIRYAHYSRTDGLEAHTFGFGMGFSF